MRLIDADKILEEIEWANNGLYLAAIKDRTDVKAVKKIGEMVKLFINTAPTVTNTDIEKIIQQKNKEIRRLYETIYNIYQNIQYYYGEEYNLICCLCEYNCKQECLHRRRGDCFKMKSELIKSYEAAGGRI